MFHAPFLLREGRSCTPIFGHNGRLKMIGNDEDQMYRTTRNGSSKLLAIHRMATIARRRACLVVSEIRWSPDAEQSLRVRESHFRRR